MRRLAKKNRIINSLNSTKTRCRSYIFSLYLCIKEAPEYYKLVVEISAVYNYFPDALQLSVYKRSLFS